MYKTFVSEELIEKWLPVIEGKNKWEAVVDGMPKVAAKDYGVISQCLENIALEERTTSADSAATDYKPILVPMIRRVMPSLIGMDIFGVQPMTGPTGLVFALRATYQNDSVNKLKRSNSVILTLADATAFTAGTDCSTTGNAGTGTVRHVEGNNVLVEVASGTFAAGADIDDAISFSSAVTTISAVYENEALFNIIFSNYSGPVTTAAGEALTTDMKEIGFEIESQTTTAKTHKLKAKWTNEMEEDLKAVHNLNAESLLSGVASDEIVMEMNREFINLVGTKATAGGTSAWDYSSADGRWEAEKAVNLVGAINRARRDIGISTKRGQGNWIIVSPNVQSLLELSDRLQSTGLSGDVDPVKNAYVGNLKGSNTKVFVDIFAPNDDVLVGYKGSSEIDAGIFYSPYVPLKISKGMGEEDGQPRTFFSTRYGLTYNPLGGTSGESYYRRVTVANIPA